MKRIVSLILALMLTLSLCACGEKEAEQVDLTAFYETLFTGDDAPMMMEADADMLDTIYPGLTDIPRVENADDVSKVEDILRARISYQVDDLGAWYPATIESWKNNSEVVSVGNYVALFVADNKDAMVESFRALF